MSDVPDGEPSPARPTLARLLLRPSVAVVAAIGVLVRIWILLTPHGALNADEAYTGLQAIDITRGHFPVVIGGAAYTGTLDTYVLAPILWLGGGNVVLLKLMSPVLWAIAAVVAVAAVRRIASDAAALTAGALVWLAPGALAIVSTRSYVAYGLALVLVLAAIWSAFGLVADDSPPPLPSAVFGFVVGLAVYSHPMFGAVVGPVAVVVVLRHRRRVRDVLAPAVGAAVVANLPFLVWNARNDWPSRHQPPITTESTYTSRLRGFFTGLLPRDLGLRRSSGEWVVARPIAGLLLLAVFGLVVLGAWTLVRRDRWLGAVLVAPLVLCWPMLALLNNLGEIDDGRYGIVFFPVLVIALVVGVAGLPRLDTRRVGWALAAVPAVWLLVFTLPMLKQQIGTDLGDPNASTRALIDVLEAEGYDRVAGNYVAVLPIEYMSDARIRVAVAGNPYVIRLPHTQQLVDATPADRLAYVFAPGEIGPTWVKLPVDQYRQVPVAGWVVYFPT